MGTVLGDLLPLTVGVAVSPVPIIAVIPMLLAPRAGAASVANFLTGVDWLKSAVEKLHDGSNVVLLADVDPSQREALVKTGCSTPSARSGWSGAIRCSAQP